MFALVSFRDICSLRCTLSSRNHHWTKLSGNLIFYIYLIGSRICKYFKLVSVDSHVDDCYGYSLQTVRTNRISFLYRFASNSDPVPIELQQEQPVYSINLTIAQNQPKFVLLHWIVRWTCIMATLCVLVVDLCKFLSGAWIHINLYKEVVAAWDMHKL